MAVVWGSQVSLPSQYRCRARFAPRSFTVDESPSQDRTMPNLIIACIVCVVGAVFSAFLTVTLASGSQAPSSDFAGKVMLAIFPFFLSQIPKVREVLDSQQVKRNGAEPADINSLGSYDVAPDRAILYATLVGFAAVNLATLLSGFVVGSVVAGPGSLDKSGLETLRLQLNADLLNPVALVCELPILFMVGRWVGQRCAKQGIMIVLVSAFLTLFAASLVHLFMMSGTGPGAAPGFANGIGSFLLPQVSGALIFSAVMLVGYLLGQRQRLPTYFSYLLHQVSPASRLAIVDLAYEQTLEKTSSVKIRKPRSATDETPATHAAYVLGVAGPYTGSRFPAQSELVFGRDPQRCSVIFDGSKDGISAQHCAVKFEPASCTFLLRDLGSSNGTFVNGYQVKPNAPKQLRNGDEFYLHTMDCRFAVRLGEAA